MKRIKKIVAPCLAVALLCVGLCGCKGEKDLGEYAFTPIEYEYDFYKFRVLEPDEGVLLDGKLDEEFWQDQKELIFSMNGITVKAKTYFGEYAAYVGVYVDDECVYDNPNREDWRNTSLELHLASGAATAHTEAIQLRVEAGGRTGSLVAVDYSVIAYGWDYDYVPFYARTHVDGELNTSNCEGIGFEIEIPWTSLGMSEKGNIGCLPAYNHTNGYEKLDGVERLHFQATGDMNDPASYPLFGENGFLGDNEEDSDFLGASAVGRARSAGWDLSRKAEHVAGTIKMGQQYIFFKQAPLSSGYTFSTKISNVSGEKAGVICGMNGSGWITAFLVPHDSGLTLDIVQMDDYGWYYQESVSVNAENILNDTGCQLEITRDGDAITIKLDGTDVLNISASFLRGESVPGFFTINAYATYSEYSYKQN